MDKFFKLASSYIAAIVIALLCGIGGHLAVAQGYNPASTGQNLQVPQVSNVGTADLFQDLVNGAPQAPNYYASAQAINGVIGYLQYITPSTGFSYTSGNSTQLLYLVPSATLATGTVTMAPNPGDGQVFTLMSTQTQTAITIAANTSFNSAQTLYTSNGALATPTALVANTQYKWVYVKAQSAWFRIQ